MCIIAAKYFKDKGWILAKNRDQDYVSNLSFRDEKDDKVGEILVMYDNDIDYQEGMNHEGLVIITTSLTPQLSEETNKKDGDKIYKALHMSQKDAANYLIKEKMTGYIFLTTPEKLMLIEAAKMDDGKGEYKAKLRVVPTNELVVRTNHGVEFPWAGFQYGITPTQDIWRKSSEMRKKYAEQAVAKADTPVEMLDALASKMDKDLQMNLFRIELKERQMRTIFQWALVPSEGIAYIRPIQVKMKLKVSHDKLRVQMVDNEIIKKTYDGKVKHFSRIKELNGGTEFMTVQTENWMYFRDYLNQKSA